ncbi:ParB/RepB/Spo0J family partition protein [Chachezhania sediminis]|uniref:ParB/RepB/Spo0J family partition protein n=1 Tax=Chachezhania sediminis TaxID=2599291 RepID=UPI00131C2126|nr:ParB/RepB/Spo0J family partition protein [Chachezhania sediminis]
MAKRRRLAPAGPFAAAPETPEVPSPAPSQVPPSPRPLGPAPIAQVAGEAAATAALAELSAEMTRARAQGRLIETLPLEAIDPGHLVRDRLALDEDEMQALMASLKARGQQTPIEVIALPDPRPPLTHGLISGWRRLAALKRLLAETGDPRFATVAARVIPAGDAAESYVAMVEENEIRVNLSHYERARIAWSAHREGVYPTVRAALQGLFGAVSRSRRSKIGTFVPLVEALDGTLRFPAAIPEKLGLSLGRALEAADELGQTLRAKLETADAPNAETELVVLQEALAGIEAPASLPPVAPPRTPAAKSPAPDLTRYDIAAGLVMRHWTGPAGDRIEIAGRQVDARFLADLKAWLERR